MYGVNQSFCQWYKLLDTFLKSSGFMPAFADPALYIFESDGKLVPVLDYVDNILPIRNKKSQLKDNVTKLLKTFEAHTIDDLQNVLCVSNDNSNYSVKLHHRSLIEIIMKWFKMQAVTHLQLLCHQE